MFKESADSTEAVEQRKAAMDTAAQLFIRNLSFELTTEDLVRAFESFGPLKNVSIATTKDGKSRGFGFVKFAFADDAKAAKEQLQGSELRGRELIVESAVKSDTKGKKRAGLDEGDIVESLHERHKRVAAANTERADSKGVAKMTADLDAVSAFAVSRSMQVVVYGMNPKLRKKLKIVANKIVRKSDAQRIKQEDPLYPLLSVLAPDGDIILVTLTNRKDAKKFLDGIQGKTMAQLAALSPVGSAIDDADDAMDMPKKTKAIARLFSDVTLEYLRKRHTRVIIRNLSFQATEANVMDKLLRFGPLVEVNIPRLPSSLSTGLDGVKLKQRGFAFATFLCESDAKTAVEQSQGLKVCNREVAIDYAMSKTGFLREGQEAEVGAAGEETKPPDDAIDTADRKTEDGDDDNYDVISEEGDDDDDDDNDNDDEEEEEDDDAVEEADEEAGMVIFEQAAQSSKTRNSSDVEDGCTLFVRGVPFDATDDDVRRAFVAQGAGKVELAIVVKDKVTGLSKGCAFVKFAKKEGASACLAQISGSGDEEVGHIVVVDRKCMVTLAVSREKAEAIVENRKLHGVPKDKRNLYLANEGLTFKRDKHRARDQGKEKKLYEADEMSQDDKAKRIKAQQEKNRKLQNPLFYVSATRLSVRNMGKGVSDKELRSFVIDATKVGVAKGLVSKDDIEAHCIAQGMHRIGDEYSIPRVDSNSVKSHKVMMDNMKLRGGLPQSRGYAFVEFQHHVHALACLREMNNNASYTDKASGGKSRLIVEFSLENSEKVNILNAREKKRKQFAAEASRLAKERNIAKSNTAALGSHQDKKRKRREGPGERRKRMKESAALRAVEL